MNYESDTDGCAISRRKIESIADRVDMLTSIARNVAAETYEIGDRLLGSIPVPGETKSSGIDVPSGDISLLSERLDSLEKALRDASDNVTRLLEL